MAEEERTVPGERLSKRLLSRTARRPRLGFVPEFYARHGLEDPWAEPQASQEGPPDGFVYLSGAPYYAMMRRLAAARKRRERRRDAFLEKRGVVRLRAAARRWPGEQAPRIFSLARLALEDQVYAQAPGVTVAPAEPEVEIVGAAPPRKKWAGSKLITGAAAWGTAGASTRMEPVKTPEGRWEPRRREAPAVAAVARAGAAEAVRAPSVVEGAQPAAEVAGEPAQRVVREIVRVEVPTAGAVPRPARDVAAPRAAERSGARLPPVADAFAERVERAVAPTRQAQFRAFVAEAAALPEAERRVVIVRYAQSLGAAAAVVRDLAPELVGTTGAPARTRQLASATRSSVASSRSPALALAASPEADRAAAQVFAGEAPEGVPARRRSVRAAAVREDAPVREAGRSGGTGRAGTVGVATAGRVDARGGAAAGSAPGGTAGTASTASAFQTPSTPYAATRATSGGFSPTESTAASGGSFVGVAGSAPTGGGFRPTASSAAWALSEELVEGEAGPSRPALSARAMSRALGAGVAIGARSVSPTAWRPSGPEAVYAAPAGSAAPESIVEEAAPGPAGPRRSAAARSQGFSPVSSTATTVTTGPGRTPAGVAAKIPAFAVAASRAAPVVSTSLAASPVQRRSVALAALATSTSPASAPEAAPVSGPRRRTRARAGAPEAAAALPTATPALLARAAAPPPSTEVSPRLPPAIGERRIADVPDFGDFALPTPMVTSEPVDAPAVAPAGRGPSPAAPVVSRQAERAARVSAQVASAPAYDARDDAPAPEGTAPARRASVRAAERALAPAVTVPTAAFSTAALPAESYGRALSRLELTAPGAPRVLAGGAPEAVYAAREAAPAVDDPGAEPSPTPRRSRRDALVAAATRAEPLPAAQGGPLAWARAEAPGESSEANAPRPSRWAARRSAVRASTAYQGAYADAAREPGSRVLRAPGSRRATTAAEGSFALPGTAPSLPVESELEVAAEPRVARARRMHALATSAPVGADEPTWAARADGTPRVTSVGGLFEALARTTSAEEVVRVLFLRADGLRAAPSEVRAPIESVIQEIRQEVTRAEPRPVTAAAETVRPSRMTAPEQRPLSQAARRVSASSSTKPSTAAWRGATVLRSGDDRVMKLVRKLQDLIHLAEAQNRLSDARRQVRMAEDSAQARGEAGHGVGQPTPGSPHGGSEQVDVESLIREVSSMVSNELEHRRQRRTEDPDESVWW